MSRNNFCVHDSRVVVTPTRDIQEAHPLIPYQIPPGQLLDKDRRWISLQIWAEHVVPLRPRLERTGWWISQLCATTAAVAHRVTALVVVSLAVPRKLSRDALNRNGRRCGRCSAGAFSLVVVATNVLTMYGIISGLGWARQDETRAARTGGSMTGDNRRGMECIGTRQTGLDETCWDEAAATERSRPQGGRG